MCFVLVHCCVGMLMTSYLWGATPVLGRKRITLPQQKAGFHRLLSLSLIVLIIKAGLTSSYYLRRISMIVLTVKTGLTESSHYIFKMCKSYFYSRVYGTCIEKIELNISSFFPLDLTQSYDESPYTKRKFNSQLTTQKVAKTSITKRLRTDFRLLFTLTVFDLYKPTLVVLIKTYEMFIDILVCRKRRNSFVTSLKIWALRRVNNKWNIKSRHNTVGKGVETARV